LLRLSFAKISLIIIIIGFFTSCNTIKRVGENEYLLTDTSVFVNEKRDLSETVNNLLYQKRNSRLLGVPLRLHIYNLARPNLDSILRARIENDPKKANRKHRFLSKKQYAKLIESKQNFNSWLKRTGEAPVIIDTAKTRKSRERLENYFWHNGWFDVETSSTLKPKEDRRAGIDYFVTTGKPYLIDSISTQISSPLVDSLYQNFENESGRIASALRNSGVYHFDQDYVFFVIDSIFSDKKVNVDLRIPDRVVKTEDSTKREPFKVYHIKDVNILTDYSYDNRDKVIKDSTTYNNYNLYSVNGLKYRPKDARRNL